MPRKQLQIAPPPEDEDVDESKLSEYLESERKEASVPRLKPAAAQVPRGTLSVRIPVDLIKRLKMAALVQDRELQEIVPEALMVWLEAQHE